MKQRKSCFWCLVSKYVWTMQVLSLITNKNFLFVTNSFLRTKKRMFATIFLILDVKDVWLDWPDQNWMKNKINGKTRLNGKPKLGILTDWAITLHICLVDTAYVILSRLSSWCYYYINVVLLKNIKIYKNRFDLELTMLCDFEVVTLKLRPCVNFNLLSCVTLNW